jgi:formate dehydrogenase maturation protein FdhE
MRSAMPSVPATVDEFASVPLNLWAQEHGYAKVHPNLLGM